MRGINRFLAGALLSASFLVSSAAQAMPIPQFDKLTVNQRADFTVFLIKCAHDILAAEGKTADAEKVIDLFDRKSGRPSPHLAEFVENVNGVRKLNQENASDPKFKPFEVEHALSLTLRNNGIFVPVSKLLLASHDYKPPQPGNQPLHTPPRPQ
jgi:hypothetical protein